MRPLPCVGVPCFASHGVLWAGDLGNGRHFATWHDPFPKPSYLFALVGGNLACVEDSFVTMSGREVALKIYVEHGKESRCAYAMDALKRAMLWDEEAFGREYDLDIFMIVAVSDFNMGAMENKGLNIFNDKYVLASADTATDADFANIEAVIAHEYFHNWTGNRITCRDWFQLCLKEGLTVFRDQEFTSDQRSRPVKRIADVRGLRGHQFVEDAGPLSHPVRPAVYHEISNFYTSTIYEKGAEVVRMLKTMLGPAGFRHARRGVAGDGFPAGLAARALQGQGAGQHHGHLGLVRQGDGVRLVVQHIPEPEQEFIAQEVAVALVGQPGGLLPAGPGDIGRQGGVVRSPALLPRLCLEVGLASRAQEFQSVPESFLKE